MIGRVLLLYCCTGAGAFGLALPPLALRYSCTEAELIPLFLFCVANAVLLKNEEVGI